MGISGLLPCLVQIQRRRHIKEYQNKTVGVDALCWMHQGAYQMAKDFVKAPLGSSARKAGIQK